MNKFSGGSGLFAEGVQAAVNDKMAKACEELVEMEQKRVAAAKAAAAEEATNFTGNKNAKVYINDAQGNQSSGKSGVGEGASNAERDDSSGVDSDDEFLDDPELERIREVRIQQMKQRQAQKKRGFGEYREIVEPEFLKEVTSIKNVVCHFYHREYIKCKVMDKHLKRVARLHPGTKFVKLNVEKAPFMVQKLAVRTLPTVITFEDGIAKDRIVGFEGLGGDGDDFKSRILEMRLVVSGALQDESDFGDYPDDEEVSSIFEAAEVAGVGLG